MKRLCVALLFVLGPAPAWAATPTLVQHVAIPSTGSSGVSVAAINFQLPNASLSGNLLLVCVSWQVASGVSLPASGVTDNQSQSYTLTATSTNGNSAACYYKANTAAGVTKITATFTTGATKPDFVTGTVSEWYNVASSPTVLTGTRGSGSSTSSWSVPSFSPTSGDLVYQYAVGNGNFSDVDGFTAGSGFTLLSAQNSQSGQVTQYRTAPGGSITPTITAGPSSGGYVSLAVSFTSATQGTAPTATPRIVRMQHSQLSGNTSPVTDQFPCSGNLIVITGSTVSMTVAPADSNSNAYTRIVRVVNQGGGAIDSFYAKNATCSATMTTSVSYTGPNEGGADIVYYDITGADTSAPLDTGTTAGTCSACTTMTCSSGACQSKGIQNVAGNLTAMVATPSGSGELFIGHIDHNTGNETGTVTDGNGHTPLFGEPWLSNNDGNFAQQFVLDSGIAILLQSDTTQLSVTFTRSASPAQEWEMLRAYFKAAAPAVAPSPPTNLRLD